MAVTPGYDNQFHTQKLPLPIVNKTICAPLKTGKGYEVKYTHYSSIQHKERMLPIMTAVNIRGEESNSKTRGKDKWNESDQVDSIYQLGDDFYKNDLNTFDRGHLVRRVDPSWGNDAVAAQADLETFKFTNCTPQHKKLNQRGGVWFELEQHVMENGVKDRIADISVFSGPVLDAKDRAFVVPYNGKEVKIPAVFWKVIVWKKSDRKLYAVGFMMSQWQWIKDKLKAPAEILREVKAKPPLKDDYFENLKFADHKTYQVPVSDIEKATGISFNWKNVQFPYKQKAYTAIKGVALRKPYRFTILRSVLKKYRSMGEVVDKKALKKLVVEKEPATKEKINEMAGSGYAGAVRRYALTNVTL